MKEADFLSFATRIISYLGFSIDSIYKKEAEEIMRHFYILFQNEIVEESFVEILATAVVMEVLDFYEVKYDKEEVKNFYGKWKEEDLEDMRRFVSSYLRKIRYWKNIPTLRGKIGGEKVGRKLERSCGGNY